MDPERDEKPEPSRGPRSALALNWESAAKIGAALLLAIAVITTLPALMRSDRPAPLEPDVGLPQAAVAPRTPPGPDPAALARRKKAKRLAGRRAAEKRRAAKLRAAQRRARQGRHRGAKPGRDADAATPQPAAAVSAPAAPPPTREKFGFEQP